MGSSLEDQFGSPAALFRDNAKQAEFLERAYATNNDVVIGDAIMLIAHLRHPLTVMFFGAEQGD